MKERVITAVVLLAVVIGALFLDPTGWAVKALVGAIILISSFELFKMIGLRLIGGSIGVLICILVYNNRLVPSLAPLIVAFIGALVLLWGVKQSWDIAKGFGAMMWLIGTLLPMYSLASTKFPAHWPLLMTAAIPIWCGDTAAIFVGRAFGKHKLAPEISPKKTWEGAAGNFAACVLAAVILGSIFHYPMLPMALLGLNCGILGQSGDLFESWLKRKADMKDSGNILPGHGGVLDRIDSLMATAPISLLILSSLIPMATH